MTIKKGSGIRWSTIDSKKWENVIKSEKAKETVKENDPLSSKDQVEPVLFSTPSHSPRFAFIKGKQKEGKTESSSIKYKTDSIHFTGLGDRFFSVIGSLVVLSVVVILMFSILAPLISGIYSSSESNNVFNPVSSLIFTVVIPVAFMVGMARVIGIL